MITLQKQFKSSQGMVQKMWRLSAFVGLLFIGGLAAAQENAIQSITANQQGSNIVVKIALKSPLAKPPVGFTINSPARIALDFANTANATGKGLQDIGLGDVRNANIVQVGDRSRLVFNLTRPLNYATTIDANAVIVTIDGTGAIPTPLNAVGLPVATPQINAGRQALRDIDFRRGNNGEAVSYTHLTLPTIYSV